MIVDSSKCVSSFSSLEVHEARKHVKFALPQNYTDEFRRLREIYYEVERSALYSELGFDPFRLRYIVREGATHE